MRKLLLLLTFISFTFTANLVYATEEDPTQADEEGNEINIEPLPPGAEDDPNIWQATAKPIEDNKN